MSLFKGLVMRTVWNITLILMAGVGLGLLIRSYQKQSEVERPGPADVVFRNDGSDLQDDLDSVSDIENPDPSHPPDEEEWLSRFELIERNGQLVKSEQLFSV